MESKITEAIGLEAEPVTLPWTDKVPPVQV